MNKRIYIFIFTILLIANALCAQKKSVSYGKADQKTPEELLKDAEKIRKSDPTASIKIIEGILLNKRDKRSVTEYRDAYYILGQIYEDIDQLDLARQRYMQALSFVGKNEYDQRGTVLYNIGIIDLKMGKTTSANEYFTKCTKIAQDNQILQKCKTGLIDVSIATNDNTVALTALNNMSKNANGDSNLLVQIEARKSQVYSQMNDFDNAAISIQNVYNTLPENVSFDDEEASQIVLSQNKLFENESISNSKKIELQRTIEYKDRNFNSNIARENFRISEVYEEEDDLEAALTSLEKSKNYINESADPDLVAQVYKKSYEYNISQGKSDEAYEDLKRYADAKEKSISELQDKLKNEVEVVKTQKSIDLTESKYELQEKETALIKNQLTTQRVIIGLLSLLIIGALISFYYLNRNIRAKNIANQLLELKSLRTQMNPHFIFNALNSVNNFIAKNDEKSANKYLSQFSKLMRMVLDYSKQDFISLREEIELNQLYTKIEHFRFRDQFEYTFSDNLTTNSDNIDVPPMLIQPFIENAVWHGLRYKNEKGKLEITIDENEEGILVTIKDDGIGRTKSKQLKTKNQKTHQSTGMNNVKKRLDVLNKTYQKNYKITIEDLYETRKDTGTIVTILLPIDR